MEHDLFLIYILVLIVLFTLAYLAIRLRREAKMTIAARRQARINAGPRHGVADGSRAMLLPPAALTPALSPRGKGKSDREAGNAGVWVSTYVSEAALG